MHPNNAITLEHPHAMTHHTRFMQRRLPVENDNVPVGEVAVDFPVDLRGARVREPDVRSIEAGRARARVGREELVRLRGAFFLRQAFL